jgi:hypothetical protein
LSESVFFLSILDMYLPVFLVCLVCVCGFLCHGVHRQTNSHSREISEIVPAHMRAHALVEITRTPLSCGGDECDADSLSLRIHTYIDRHTSMCVCLFAFLSIPDSWLPNSLFLLVTVGFICILVCLRMSHFFFSEYTSVSPRYRGLNLEHNQLSTLPLDIFAGLSLLQ